MIKRHKKRRGINGEGGEREHRLPDATTTAPPTVNDHMPSGGLGPIQPHEAMSQPKPALSADTTARVEPKRDHEGAAT